MQHPCGLGRLVDMTTLRHHQYHLIFMLVQMAQILETRMKYPDPVCTVCTYCRNLWVMNCGLSQMTGPTLHWVDADWSKWSSHANRELFAPGFPHDLQNSPLLLLLFNALLIWPDVACGIMAAVNRNMFDASITTDRPGGVSLMKLPLNLIVQIVSNVSLFPSLQKSNSSLCLEVA